MIKILLYCYIVIVIVIVKAKLLRQLFCYSLNCTLRILITLLIAAVFCFNKMIAHRLVKLLILDC